FIADFIHAYYYGVAEEDLAAHRLEDLAGAALWHLNTGAERRQGRPFVHVFNPEPAKDGFACTHTVVATIADDRPFLLDSTTMVLSQSGLAIHFIAHPV